MRRDYHPKNLSKKSFKPTAIIIYMHVLQISVLLRAKGTIILVCTAHIYRIKYLSAIYVPANLTKRYPGNKNMLFLTDDIHPKRDNECRLCTIHIVCPPITHHRKNLKQMPTPDNP